MCKYVEGEREDRVSMYRNAATMMMMKGESESAGKISTRETNCRLGIFLFFICSAAALWHEGEDSLY